MPECIISINNFGFNIYSLISKWPQHLFFKCLDFKMKVEKVIIYFNVLECMCP